jgi:mannose-1-phosphate guanylyltransferase/mannose-6-phosphate isomerase
MIVVIIAGGSGTRLWPLSTPAYPKHLLKINRDNRSLLQNTYNRAKQLSDDIFIVSEVSHIHHVKSQLPDLSPKNFIVEPGRRGTASCIIAALVKIAANHDTDEPVTFLSADHYIRDTAGFVHSFNTAAKTAKKEGHIILVGAEPTYPATGLGYIQKDNLLSEENYVYNVHSFKEKPNFETAQKYLKSGKYLWNCGYFIGSINVFKKTMQKYSPKLYSDYLKLEKAKESEFKNIYLNFENISIDYALIEKVKKLLVVPANFDWMDLGSFNDLYESVDHDEMGNHVVGKVGVEEVENSFIQNHESKPIAVIGLDNIVVINTKEGILVARKDLSQKVGDVSKRLLDMS